MLPFHKGDRIATTAGGAARPQSKALWELSPLTRGTDGTTDMTRSDSRFIPVATGNTVFNYSIFYVLVSIID